MQGTNNENLILWRELENKKKWGRRWAVGGDFNMVLRSNERSGDQFSRACAKEFKEILDKLDLMDLPLVEGKWTWINQKSKSFYSRINQCLMSSNYLLQSGLHQKVLTRPIYDHFPINFVSDGTQLGSVPFRLDYKWFKMNSLRCMIKKMWKDTKVKEKASFNVVTKLKSLKAEINKWTKDEGLKEEKKINDLMQELDEMDKKDDEGLTLDEGEKREILGMEIANRLLMEEVS